MDSNRTRIAIVVESTPGTTPATPAFQILRITGEDFKAEKETVVSAELRSDRQIADFAKVNSGASGGFKFELSYGSFSTLIVAALGTAAVVVSETVVVTFASAGQTMTIDAGTWAVTPLPGQFLKISGAADTGNNGIKRVVAASTTVITFAAGSITDNESADSVSIKGTAYKNGLLLPQYTVERTTNTTAGADYLQAYRGMGVDEFSISIATAKITEGSFSFVGFNGTTYDAPIAGATYAAAATTQVQNATSHVASVFRDGVVSTEHITGIDFSVKNNLRAKNEIGRDGAFELGLGGFGLTGKITTYFADNTLYAAMIAHDYSSLAFVTTDAAGNSMAFHMPRINFMPADPNATAKNTDIMMELPFQAILDPTTGATFIVTEILA